MWYRTEISNLVPSSSASMEGVFVGNISPTETSRNKTRVKYFDNGAKTVSFAFFKPNLRSRYGE